MGSGKTISTLTAIDELISDGEIRHALVIAPKRVAQMVWPEEIEGWSHTAKLRYAVLDGNPIKRAELLNTAHWRDLTIIGIDNVQWLCEQLAELPDDSPVFDLLVIDETSRFKDPASKRGKALFKQAHRFRNRWGLTGTPRPNSAMDLFGPARIVTAGQLWGKSFYAWRQKHFYQADFRGYDWKPQAGHEALIEREFAAHAITIRAEDMPELPELTVLIDHVHMPRSACENYKTMEKKLFAELDRKDVLAATAAVATGKLAQIANGFIYDENGKAEHLHEAKLDWLDELVEGAGEPMIVVYEFIEDRERILARYPGTPFLGGIVTDSEAISAITRWNKGELPLLLIHPASAGHGLNLQSGGSRMAWFGPSWSPEMWDQTIARLHRPGQKRQVMVHVCIVPDTVDELKRSRVVDKMTAQEAFLKYLQSRQLEIAA